MFSTVATFDTITTITEFTMMVTNYTQEKIYLSDKLKAK